MIDTEHTNHTEGLAEADDKSFGVRHNEVGKILEMVTASTMAMASVRFQVTLTPMQAAALVVRCAVEAKPSTPKEYAEEVANLHTTAELDAFCHRKPFGEKIQ